MVVLSFALFAGSARAQVSVEDLLKQLNQLQEMLTKLKGRVETQKVAQPTTVTTPTGVVSGFVTLDELPGSPTVSCVIKPLSRGSWGGSVFLLQMFLKQNGNYPQGLITGFYGNLTQRAVREFQISEMKGRGLFNGIVDEETANKISSAIGKYFSECGTVSIPVVLPTTPIETSLPTTISGVRVVSEVDPIRAGNRLNIEWDVLAGGSSEYDITLLNSRRRAWSIINGFPKAAVGACEGGKCWYAWTIPSDLKGSYYILVEGGEMGKGGKVARGTSSYFTIVSSASGDTSSGDTSTLPVPSISYIQQPQGDKNVLTPDYKATIYGTSITSWGSDDISVVIIGEAYTQSVTPYNVYSRSIDFVVPGGILAGSYEIHLERKGRVSNIISVRR